jgi:hypothetical protein
VTGGRRAAGAAAVSLGLALAGGAGCTFRAGDWFATMTPAVSAAWTERADRAVEPGWQRLASDYQVRLTKGELRLSSIELLTSGGGGRGDARFDPAHPPAGYTLCHNGHCHATDGRLVPYADVEAELAGGGAGPTVAVTLGETTHDLLAPAAQAPRCLPSCQLGLLTIDRVRARIARLHLEGTVRDGPGVRQSIGTRAFTLDLEGTPQAPLPTLATAADVPADNRHPPLVTLALAVQPFAGLFDGVDWAADPTAASAATAASVREALTETPLSLSVTRRDP